MLAKHSSFIWIMSLYNIPPPYPLQPGAFPLFVMLFTQHVGVILLEIENFLKQVKMCTCT